LILASQSLRRKFIRLIFARTSKNGLSGSDPHGIAKELVMAGTLAEKVWDAHLVRRAEGEPDLLYIDLHLLHEVTSPQAFDGLRISGRTVRRTGRVLWQNGEGEQDLGR